MNDQSQNFNDALLDALNAFNRDDYETAYKLFLPLAEQGDMFAQHFLALLHLEEGVNQDYKEAVKLFLLSAEQGNMFAQYGLGYMYYEGKGVLQDYVSAHMLWNISGSNGNKGAMNNRNIVEKKMTPQQIEKAQEMVRNWKPKK